MNEICARLPRLPLGRTGPWLLLGASALALGCASSSSYVHSDAALGRVVVYRNGIAYFERHAHVENDVLRLSVPADKVDDFLKSLTVVDTRTGEPPPISYPTSRPSAENGLIDMEMKLSGKGPHDLKLSYVTETPSWKPSYRLVVGEDGKVRVQAWAVVDNTSGEDWLGVKLAVGSSSALSFRYDLRSLRTVQRETLHSDDLFAQAPPMGGATHGGQPDASGKIVFGVLTDDVLRADVDRNADEDAKLSFKDGKRKPEERPIASNVTPQGQHRLSVDKKGLGNKPATDPAATGGAVQKEEAERGRLDQVARQLATTKQPVVIEGYADKADGDKFAASLERANRVREQLIRRGADPSRVVAVGNGEQAGQAGGVRIVQADQSRSPEAARRDLEGQAASAAAVEPIGTSHFESARPMDVPRGTSAMVSILNSSTAGEIVYLYDPESTRGNASFPFQSVRILNPTDSTLESGPVTVFGQGKFIGEGLSEPIPARSVGFVPFALDRQVVVDRDDAERDEILRVLAVQRGVFSTEVQHVKKRTLTFHNRTAKRATVYVRHSVQRGFKLVKPAGAEERLGAARLLRIDVDPGSKADLVIEEATPLFKTADIRSPVDRELVKFFLALAAADGPLKAAVSELLKLHQDMGSVEQQIRTTREQIEEYRARAIELNAQIVTLRAVKTAGDVMRHLEKTLQSMSEKLSASTIQLATLQEKLMISRIKFQDGVANLSLDKPAAAGGSSKEAK